MKKLYFLNDTVIRMKRQTPIGKMFAIHISMLLNVSKHFYEKINKPTKI